MNIKGKEGGIEVVDRSTNIKKTQKEDFKKKCWFFENVLSK
jgi:hypothetical protein